MSQWNGLKRSPMKRKARRKPVLPRDVRERVLNGPCAYRFANNCYGPMEVDHVVPRSLRLRHGIAFEDETYLVAACSFHNGKKLTNRWAPLGFDMALLPGVKPWTYWDGGAI